MFICMILKVWQKNLDIVIMTSLKCYWIEFLVKDLQPFFYNVLNFPYFLILSCILNFSLIFNFSLAWNLTMFVVVMVRRGMTITVRWFQIFQVLFSTLSWGICCQSSEGKLNFTTMAQETCFASMVISWYWNRLTVFSHEGNVRIF